MGQKINPVGFRLGINRTWDSRWYAGRDFAEQLHQDFAIRAYAYKKLEAAGVANVIIERLAKKPRVTIYSSRPGLIIGKKGSDIDKLKGDLSKISNSEVTLNIVEVRKPEIEAKLVAESIAQMLEKRVSYRRAMKRAVQSAMRMGALGIRVHCSGRLGGAEIARTEKAHEGKVPLHTLRADIDFARGTAQTTYGACGVKVWIYKGEILGHDPQAHEKKSAENFKVRS
jgi:small subunit ribosomal protein S3